MLAMADARTWAKRVAGWRASGQTAAEYCEQHGLGLSALRHWSQRLRREEEAGDATPVRLARVVTRPETAAGSEASPASRSALALEVRGVRITVEAGFDHATLADVLGLLGVEGVR